MRFNKTKLLSYGIVLSMTAVSMLSTSPIASAAGNVKDEEYSYVKGCYYNSLANKHINLRDCSSRVIIPVGVHGIITNSVREDGCNRARLYINSGKEQATQGVWSPDSTANSSYVVFK